MESRNFLFLDSASVNLLSLKNYYLYDISIQIFIVFLVVSCCYVNLILIQGSDPKAVVEYSETFHLHVLCNIFSEIFYFVSKNGFVTTWIADKMLLHSNVDFCIPYT